MKARIFIDPKDALKAGLNNVGEYVIEFSPADLSPAEREEMATANMAGDAFDITGQPRSNPDYSAVPFNRPEISVPGIDAVRQVLAARIDYRQRYAAHEAALAAAKKARAEEQRAEAITRLADWCALDPMGRIKNNRVDYPWMPFYGANRVGCLDIATPEQAEIIEDTESLAFWAALDASVGISAMRRAEKEAADAAAARRRDQLGKWVADHGTPEQQARHRDGYLPETEIVDAIRAETFSGLADFPRYQKLRAGDVCLGTDLYDVQKYHAVDYDVVDATELDAEQYAQLQEIKSAAPDGATVTPRIHTAECEECEEKTSRIGFMVRVRVGELDFSREYGMPE